jgi:glyceraldehyde-3-phosphate dehydrogenase (NADP+)
MKTGYIDMIAFIGSSSAADSILKDHPTPHRLNSFLQLEGKNVGVVLPDANIDTAVEQITLGSLSYNGQRCTAIKLVIVHESRLEEFLNKFTIRVDSLVSGLPWIPKVSITPLPEGTKKLKYLEALISDAVEKGARIVNEVNGGGHIYGNLMKPAIICPVTKDMKLYHEEQFGPVVPITTYSSTQELLDYFASTPYGLQAALFTENPITAAPLVDVLSTCVGRINLNTQCGRSPDSISFTGRRSSALGTMSVSEAIRAFSIETVVAGKATESNTKLLNDLESYSKFLFPL